MVNSCHLQLLSVTDDLKEIAAMSMTRDGCMQACQNLDGRVTTLLSLTGFWQHFSGGNYSSHAA